MPFDKDTSPVGSYRLDDLVERVIERPCARMALQITFWGLALGLVVYFGTLRLIAWSVS